MPDGLGCGCGNWWNNAPQSVCGSFPEPTVPDEGRCAPYRVKIDCEAPVLPVPQCSDDEYTTIYQPEVIDHPFAVLARLFDENCQPINDESAVNITTIYA